MLNYYQRLGMIVRNLWTQRYIGRSSPRSTQASHSGHQLQMSPSTNIIVLILFLFYPWYPLLLFVSGVYCIKPFLKAKNKRVTRKRRKTPNLIQFLFKKWKMCKLPVAVLIILYPSAVNLFRNMIICI